MTRLSAAAAAPHLLLLLLLALVGPSRYCGPTAAAAAAAAPIQQLAVKPANAVQQHAALHPQKNSAAKPPSRPRVHTLVPELLGYSFNTSKDTFELCHETAGLTRDIPLEELLPVFKLPHDLTKRKHINLQELIELLHEVQPEFKVVYEPMLFGEADIGSLLSPGGLPRLVHFTVKDKNKLRPHQVVSMTSWAFHNPGHSLMLFDDDDVRSFMTSYYPELLPTFDGLGSQVERTDMWRYLVLCRLGGVYADSDVVCARPVSTWAQDAGLLVGIENVFTTPEEAKRRDYTRQVQMVQWAIASRKGHPVVCRMGQYVAQHVKEEKAGEYIDPDRDHAILERTGPGIWSSSVHDYINEQGSLRIEDLVAGGKVGDMRVLPQPVFGCASATFNPEEDTLPYIYHMFKGSWRSTQPNKIMNFVKKLYAKLHKQKQQQQLAGDGSPEHDAALAAAKAAAAEAAEFARAQPTPAAGPAAAATAAQRQQQLLLSAASSSTSAATHPHPHLPILDEQILEHKRQQMQQLQQQLQQRGAAGAAAAQHRQPIRLGTGDGSSADQSLSAAAIQQLAAPVGVGGPSPLEQQLLQQVGAPTAVADAKLAAAAPVAADTRKLRSSQLLLVKGLLPSDAPVVDGVRLSAPELPSRAVSSMPALSVLVLLVLLCAVYKQQVGSFSLMSRTAAGSSPRGLCGSMRCSSVGSGLGLGPSRAGSRVMLSNGGGAVLPVAAAAVGGCGLPRPPLQDRPAVLPEQEVCYASSQQNGHPHRHKRSWGSSSNFQQL